MIFSKIRFSIRRPWNARARPLSLSRFSSGALSLLFYSFPPPLVFLDCDHMCTAASMTCIRHRFLLCTSSSVHTLWTAATVLVYYGYSPASFLCVVYNVKCLFFPPFSLYFAFEMLFPKNPCPRQLWWCVLEGCVEFHRNFSFPTLLCREGAECCCCCAPVRNNRLDDEEKIKLGCFSCNLTYIHVLYAILYNTHVCCIPRE